MLSSGDSTHSIYATEELAQAGWLAGLLADEFAGSSTARKRWDTSTLAKEVWNNWWRHKRVPDYLAVFFMRLLFFALHVLLPSLQTCAQLSAVKSGLAEQIKMNPDECN